MGRRQKPKNNQTVKINKKLKSFINNNFQDYNNITVVKETKDNAIVILDYGRREPKLQIHIGKFNEVLGLIDTKFIENF